MTKQKSSAKRTADDICFFSSQSNLWNRLRKFNLSNTASLSNYKKKKLKKYCSMALLSCSNAYTVL